MRVFAFDTETRGMWGQIFKVGFFDGENYQTFESGIDFMRFILLNFSKEENVNIYAFYLEFDFSKILKEAVTAKNKTKKMLFEVDFNRSLIINGKFHVIKIKDTDIHFRDIYPLVNCSLHTACRDFNLTVKKIELDTNGLSMEEYSKNVDANDQALLEYLKCDVLSTYELVYTLKNLSAIDMEKFVRCPTVASLSMKIFRTNNEKEFKKMKETKLFKWQEDFVRQAYQGGRVEIFKSRLAGGLHFDVNSLYPFVMESKKFPIGRVGLTRKTANQESNKELLNLLLSGDYLFFIFCRVKIPHQKIGPLPVKSMGKLIFPVGIVNGHFCRPELEYAVKNCNVEVLEIYEILWWMESDFVFKNFIEKQKEMKLNSEGAKKNFAKLIQNANYGKWGMGREREHYENYDAEKFNKIKEGGKEVAVYQTGLNECMVYNKLIFADYVLPHYAAFITSYARVMLLSEMKEQEENGNSIYYCDTDSMVCQEMINITKIDSKEYGKWKLERELEKAIFVLPKLYAEVEKNTGSEILKSKGLVKQYMREISYADYELFFEYCLRNEDYGLYGHNDNKNYYTRYNIMQAIKLEKDFDEIIKLKKKLAFSKMMYKRKYDYEKNDSVPFVFEEERLIIDVDNFRKSGKIKKEGLKNAQD